VDYAGQTVPVVDASTGEIRRAQVFVAVLGASNYTYACATWQQTAADWVGSRRFSGSVVPPVATNLSLRWWFIRVLNFLSAFSPPLPRSSVNLGHLVHFILNFPSATQKATQLVVAADQQPIEQSQLVQMRIVGNKLKAFEAVDVHPQPAEV
jgi:hypothetical protein